ncbi:MAG: ParB/RepB/Spo0J family partition protein [Bryobacterales bacterium]|nr:ParB/RepB/Spo0J family partition protein [Bryobacterales bacterium]
MSNAPDSSRKALGKGLSALLPANRASAAAPAPPPPVKLAPEIQGPAKAFEIPIDEIDPNPLQPRTAFEAGRLDELAQSIRENGIIQPLIVRKQASRFQLVAGERRWRAAKIADLRRVPVVVQDFADNRLLEVTLIENIQREDLNPIEVAHAFERLGRDLGLSHEQIATRTGKDRSTVTNMIRLLKLPSEVQILLAEQRLSMGHARALLGLPDPEQQTVLAQQVVSHGLSVRQVEKAVQRLTRESEEKAPAEVKQDPNVKAAAERLGELLGTRVRIAEKSDQRGRIEIEYYSMEELSRIYDLIAAACEK